MLSNIYHILVLICISHPNRYICVGVPISHGHTCTVHCTNPVDILLVAIYAQEVFHLNNWKTKTPRFGSCETHGLANCLFGTVSDPDHTSSTTTRCATTVAATGDKGAQTTHSSASGDRATTTRSPPSGKRATAAGAWTACFPTSCKRGRRAPPHPAMALQRGGVVDDAVISLRRQRFDGGSVGDTVPILR